MKESLQSPTGMPARSGFTLLETLLVIGLMSMLAAVLIGGSASLLKGTARSDPEDALLALMQKLRREAVEQAQTIELIPVRKTEGEEGADFTWGEDHEETLPVQAGVSVKIIGPEVGGAILLGGLETESPVARLRFYPDGTCDRVRLEIVRNENRRITPIDPLTCAPLPAVDAK